MNAITIRKGVRNLKKIKIWDKRVSPKIPMNLTGKTVMITVKKPGDLGKDDSISMIKADIIVHEDPINGVTIWDIPARESDIEPGSYLCDIKIKELGIPTEIFTVRVIDVVTVRE